MVICKLKIDISQYNIKLSSKYCYVEMSNWTQVQVNIVDDDSLQFLMGCTDMQHLHLYVETENNRGNVTLPESNLTGITQGLSTVGIEDMYGTYMQQDSYGRQGYSDVDQGIGDWDRYLSVQVGGNELTWPSNTSVGNMNTGRWETPSTEGRTVEDLSADSYRDADEFHSEPETSSSDFDHADNDDDQSGEEIDTTTRYRTDEDPSDRVTLHDTTPTYGATIPTSTYEFPSFFSVRTGPRFSRCTV